MASKYGLAASARNGNMSRNVYEPRGIYDISVFCNNTHGNFMVLGESRQRENILLEYIDSRYRSGNVPVVIFSNSESLENKIIQYQRSANCNLTVFSPNYRGYSIFSGMSEESVLLCLVETAKTINFEIDPLIKYLDAFLLLMKACNIPLSLHSMIKLSNSDNQFLVNIARQKNLRGDATDTLQNSVSGLTNLRKVLSVIKDSVSSFADAAKDSGRSIVNLFRNRDIIFVRAAGKNQNLINYIMATEIEELIGSRALFVFDNIQSASCSKMTDIIELIKNSSETSIGESIIDSKRILNEGAALVANGSLVILTENILPVALQQLLKSFGQYEHSRVDTKIEHEPLKILHSKSYGLAKDFRDRVTLDDVNGKTAVLSGDNGVVVTIATTLNSRFERMNESGTLKRI